MNKQELYDKLKTQLAIEYNCRPEDFSRRENVVTLSAANEGRRVYADRPFFFQMATLGGNAVITADERLHPWLHEYVENQPGHWLFEHRSLCRIDNQLKKYGKRLWQTHHMFLPDMEITPVKELVPVRWHEQENLHSFYAEKRFPNALCSRFMPARPDMLAVAAYDGEQIIAMAGCSADTPELWQIGIDVQEQYRGRGIGTYLVTLLKNETIRRGKIPFYGTSLSNLPSWRIALNSGFFPAWIEVETIEE